ncbi:hypothetical protein MPLB_2030039 [Mesorhizobium sp. ORS 3324]|nr:hypothetical protein MPLB_2030039 [Mesorhizobium sp. ORS 3324]
MAFRRAVRVAQFWCRSGLSQVGQRGRTADEGRRDYRPERGARGWVGGRQDKGIASKTRLSGRLHIVSPGGSLQR